MTTTLDGITRVPWAQHHGGLAWRQGEHLLLCAPTSAGKTTLMEQLVTKRGHVVVFVSKVKDDTFRHGFKDWRVVREWKEVRSTDRRVLLWPRGGKTLQETVALQSAVFRDALNRIGNGQGWCIVIDEMHYLASREFCNCGAEIAILHHQGRSQGISMVTLTQRPSWIPKIIYSSVSHAYIARTRDADDLKRLSDLGGVDRRTMGAIVSGLPDRHDYVYINSQGDAVPGIVNVRQ